jgi:hypothetical protein
MTTDASSAVYVGLNMQAGAIRELPDGAATLWSGPNGIAKFSSDGAFAWAVPSTAGVSWVVLEGSHLWAAGRFTSGSAMVADRMFTLPAGFAETFWFVKLDTSNGKVLDSYQLDQKQFKPLARAARDLQRTTCTLGSRFQSARHGR